MLDFVQLQNDVTNALLCAENLETVQVAQYRKLRMQSVIDLSSIWMNPRNGKVGCGLLVEMPTFDVTAPNLPGPEGDLGLTVVVLEEPNINMEPTSGSQIAAEEAAQWVLDTLHGLLIDGVGALYADRNAIREASEFTGVVAYRVAFRVKALRPQTGRVATPTITETNLEVTFTCNTPGATIYYTTDGSFPGPSNPAAIQFDGNLFTFSGSALRWAAYAPGLVGSNVGQATP
ncbi:MAG: chitobiase/beta-hexosaminidase C-terminal domain-containing protein [Patescibacteria group bacterium]|nr:chitobiase/beta-hexosaminidase C-terminal domain-containing protein [Patescibacteria group bacterium]